jgi:hypothetical protein
MPKAKRVKIQDARPAIASVEPEERNDAPIGAAPFSRPTTMAPRSFLRTTPSTRGARSGATGLTTDYRYVVADLKRIAVLAGATFAVLFGLTFIIR